VSYFSPRSSLWAQAEVALGNSECPLFLPGPTTLVVKNCGTGPALNCTAKFVTVRINVLSNVPGRIEEPETTECLVDPRNIMPGQDARILGVPDCFDLKRTVADAQGYIVFECEQLDGTKQQFKEPFDMWQGYAAKPYPLLKVNTWGPKSPWLVN
jgi:hypothetical protein